LVTNCRKCQSSVRLHCTLKKENGKKTYVDNEQRAKFEIVKTGQKNG